MTNPGYARGSVGSEKLETITPQSLVRREDGGWVLTLADDRIKDWIDDERYFITNRGDAYDTKTGRRVRANRGRAYPVLVEMIGSGRLIPGLRKANLRDSITGKAIGPAYHIDESIPTSAGVWNFTIKSEHIQRRFIPVVPLTSDPIIVRLWGELVSLRALDAQGESVSVAFRLGPFCLHGVPPPLSIVGGSIRYRPAVSRSPFWISSEERIQSGS
jgi:hypothetical protein